MGSTQPQNVVRDIEATLTFCREKGVNCQSRIIGQWPTWPGGLQDARVRYALRFLAYLQRSATTRRNFVLVSHADCVGAILSIMPSMMEKVITGIEYGGLFLARRKLRVDSPKTEGNDRFLTVLPTTSEGDQSPNPNLDELEVCEADLPNVLTPKHQGNWMRKETSEVPASHSLKQSKACEGWQ